MSGPIVLVIEGNPITRAILVGALECEGYGVMEAASGRAALTAAHAGRPDLIVVDSLLCDGDGIQLLARLRRELATPRLPALVLTATVSPLSTPPVPDDGFTDLLLKPIEPSQLLDMARAYLAPTGAMNNGQTVLVVDDEPLPRKLALLRLRHHGYAVVAAAGGAEALELALAAPPDAVIANLGMPEMDGFTLCRELRRAPRLAAIPIILVSAIAIEEADRRLARILGASALAPRTADWRGAIEALRVARGGEHGQTPSSPSSPSSPLSPMSPPAPEGETEIAALHRQRVRTQLDRQITLNRELARQASIQATALALMRRLTEVIGKPANVCEVIGKVLMQCLDAAGLSTGLLYLVSPEGSPQLQAHSGLPADLRAPAEACFGHPELFRSVAGGAQPVAIRGLDGGAGADFLHRLGKASALAMPFAAMGDAAGVLVLAADQQDLSDPSWLGFASSLAVQFGQTLALGQSLNRLAASEERYSALMEQANDAIVILDLDFQIVGINQAGLRLFGLSSHEIVGSSYYDFVVPEEREASRTNRTRLLRDMQVRVPLRHLLRGDGTRVPVEMSVSVAHIGDETTVLAIFHDITERRRLEAQVQQAQKMESVGRLAGGVAHDFNNLLTLILGYGSLVLHALTDRPELHRQVEAIVHAGESAAALTRQLLAFSRRQILVPTVLDVNALIRQLERMLQRLISEDIELITSLEPNLGRLRADATQIEQVLMNLVINARDAMPHGGRMTLSTRHHPPPPAPPTHVVLTLGDTGSGIDEAVLPHIFETFFTTKEEGKGTGLGLATVHGIVNQSGGHLEVASRPGEGSTFSVYLPVTDEPLPPASVAAAAPGHGHETILVAEDEAVLRSLVREILRAHGYIVLLASSADEALHLAERHDRPIHLLLTDVIMQGRSGVELAEALLAHRPALRVIYMSGYADRAMQTVTPGATFLQKPFNPAILVRRVRSSLDQA